MNGIVPEGSKAPGFTLATDGADTVTLRQFLGGKLVIFFYPKADTSGCTQEALAFNGLRKQFAKAGTALLGVSADPLPALEKFKKKHGLSFPLGSDPKHAMLQAYGVWGEKTLYGRKYMGITRTTYLIAPAGRVARVWPKVRIAGHAEEVLEAARTL